MDRSPVKAAFPLEFSCTISVFALHQRRARSKGRSHCRARCRSCRQFRNPTDVLSVDGGSNGIVAGAVCCAIHQGLDWNNETLPYHRQAHSS
ncbi:hypothetical protein PCANC_10468 [Puccinia coronata f. sp. avenae]|uniref:Uncharacterized protein n=1 Tax=Puccinia coronata f. sp. avenae TaxID=200324 RepID=A0A2N5VI96_9BASI|nr:hypothetical protein PCANC_10468 [Puccinia coronata f. sp. avenae]